MLAIAAIMMTTASYAWFTISTNPEISDISAQVTANGNLEIQLAKTGTAIEDFEAPVASAVGDAGKNQTWGNLVDLEEYFSSAATKITLKPVEESIAANKKSISFTAPTFGLDGRIKNLVDLNRTEVSNGSVDNFKDFAGGIHTFNGDAAAFTGNNNAAWCFEIDFFMRSNVTGTITFQEAANVYRDTNTPANSAEKGLGSYIQYNSNPSSKDMVTIKVVEYTPGQTVTKADGTTQTITADTTGTVHSVKIGNLTSNKGLLTLRNEADTEDQGISLTANQYKLVKVYVYMDGSNLTNADFLNAVTTFSLNLQFKHSTTLVDMQPTQSQYSANSANGGTDTARP